MTVVVALLVQEELAKMKVDFEKSKNQERIAKKQIQTTFNPAKLLLGDWVKQREAKDGRLKELEEKVKELQKGAPKDARVKELEEKVAQMQKASTVLEEKVKAAEAAAAEAAKKLKEKAEEKPKEAPAKVRGLRKGGHLTCPRYNIALDSSP